MPFANVLHLSQAIFRFAKAIRKQKSYQLREIYPVLQRYLQHPTESISERVERKARYYSLYGTALIGECYALLRQKPLSITERKRLSWLGVLTPLLDEFFDNPGLTDTGVPALMEAPEKAGNPGPEAGLAVEAWKVLLDIAPAPDAMRERAWSVFRSQQESHLQKDPASSEAELYRATFEKGGQAALLFREMLDNAMVEGEREAVFQLGGLIQLLDDLFDLFEDRQNGIRTLVSEMQSAEALSQQVKREIRETFRRFGQLSYSPQGIRAFFYALLLICSRGYVATRHFRKVAKNKDGPLRLENWSRAELVCDMEKGSNILLNIRYYLQTDPFD
jgi:hypothetical protein